jgi:hypothetical protein
MSSINRIAGAISLKNTYARVSAGKTLGDNFTSFQNGEELYRLVKIQNLVKRQYVTGQPAHNRHRKYIIIS